MKMTNIANRDARGYVERRDAFKGSNLRGEWNGDRYVVYSYDTHHPLFVYDEVAEQWYENMTYASRTTQKHRTQTRPQGVDIIPLHANDMHEVAKHGAVGLIMAVEEREKYAQMAELNRKSLEAMAQGLNGTSTPTRLIVPYAIVQLAEKIASADENEKGGAV